MSIEAMKQALEALNYLQGLVDTERGPKAAAALRQAIDQAEKQEPVAWKTDDIELYVREDKFGFYNIPLYTIPQPQREWVEVECPLCGEMAVAHTHPVLNKREWVGLTDDEVISLMKQFPDNLTRDVARAIEAKLKEKNA